MRLTMKERKQLTAVMAPEYQKARKKDKGGILEQFLKATQYNRYYAAHVLKTQGRKIRVNTETVVMADARKGKGRKKERVYDRAVEAALKEIWEMMDFLCGKRLAPILKELIPRLLRFREIRLTDAVRDKLMKISPSTIDRILASERKKFRLKDKANTKPGTLLKHQIPIRTFSEWNDKRPGFVEIDLVGHDGGDGSGEFLQTLDVTDVAGPRHRQSKIRPNAGSLKPSKTSGHACPFPCSVSIPIPAVNSLMLTCSVIAGTRRLPLPGPVAIVRTIPALSNKRITPSSEGLSAMVAMIPRRSRRS